jgi:hypothetical protein
MDRYINGTWEPSPKNTIGAAFAAKKVRGLFKRWDSISSVVPPMYSRVLSALFLSK